MVPSSGEIFFITQTRRSISKETSVFWWKQGIDDHGNLGFELGVNAVEDSVDISSEKVMEKNKQKEL